MKKKTPKPIRAWMAYNYGNPWEDTTRRLRKDCIAATKANLINPREDYESGFKVHRVLITPVR